VQENIRDIVIRGDETVTCLSCHEVHRQSSSKHQRVARRDLCLNCHDATGRQSTYDATSLRSATCRY
jgi:predicted CXXCH cytochrome family protein